MILSKRNKRQRGSYEQRLTEVYGAYEGPVGVKDESKNAGSGWILHSLKCLHVAWPELTYL